MGVFAGSSLKPIEVVFEFRCDISFQRFLPEKVVFWSLQGKLYNCSEIEVLTETLRALVTIHFWQRLGWIRIAWQTVGGFSSISETTKKNLHLNVEICFISILHHLCVFKTFTSCIITFWLLKPLVKTWNCPPRVHELFVVLAHDCEHSHTILTIILLPWTLFIRKIRSGAQVIFEVSFWW